MGLKAKLLEFLRTVVPDAFGAEPTPEERENLCYVDDAIGYVVRTIRNHNNSRVLTGDEFGLLVMTRITERFKHVGCKHYVMLLDDHPRVPSQKHDEQADRDKQKKPRAPPKTKAKPKLNKNVPRAPSDDDDEKYEVEVKKPYKPAVLPYEVGSTIHAGGIAQPKYDNGMPQPIDMDRMAVTRHMRRMLFGYLFLYLKTNMHSQYSVPPGATFYLDYDPAGPWRFRAGEAPVQMTWLKHPLGEADLMIMLWVKYFRYTGAVLVYSIDSDIPLLLMNYLDNHRSQPGVTQHGLYVTRGKQSKEAERKLDIKKLFAGIGDRWVMLMIVTVMLGTDFHHKGKMLHRVGDQDMFTWVWATEPLYTSWHGWNLNDLLRGVPNVWERPFANVHLLPEEADKHNNKEFKSAPPPPTKERLKIRAKEAAKFASERSALAAFLEPVKKGPLKRKADDDDLIADLLGTPKRQSGTESKSSPLNVSGRLIRIIESAMEWIAQLKAKLKEEESGKKAPPKRKASAKAKAKSKAKPTAINRITEEGVRSWAWNLQYWLIDWNAIEVCQFFDKN
jgi:hypothetical protein